MINQSTTVLVRRAKAGDRAALSALVDRFYHRWLRKFHGDLCTTIRKGYDTVDLVQSAIGNAIEKLPQLRNEGVFFCWVTHIIRHKIATKRRRLRHERALERSDGRFVVDPVAPSDGSEKLEQEEIMISVLEDIDRFFPEYPGEMAAISLNQLHSLSIAQIAKRLGISERAVFRLLKKAHEILRKRWTE